MKDPGRPGSSGPLDPAAASPRAGGASRSSNGDATPAASPRGAEGSGVARAAGASAPRRLPEPGERIGPFLLEEHIGTGGMGTVYRARDLCLERRVALKVLPGELAGDPDVVPRFYQEARSAARLDHENIARIFSIGHDNGFHYIAFEFIDGPNLRQRVQEGGPLSAGEAIDVTLQIAGALVHAAERGVVHRDIKPSNLILTPQGRAKLVDMGLARRFEREGASPDEGLTQSGMTLGTFDYISPEQASDPRAVDIRSDLYSLGCTMFHMLTGRPPFPEGTVLQKLLQHREEAPPDVRTLAPDVPADLAAIVLKLMAKDPDRRYQSAEALGRDLVTVAGANGLQPYGPEGLSWLAPAKPASWERHLVWGLPSVGLAALVALLVWWGQANDPSPTATPPVLPPPAPSASRAAAPSGVPVAASPRATTAAVVVEADPPGTVAPAPAAGRRIAVRTDAQLEEALRRAPSGAEIVLEEAGPFTLRAVAVPPADRVAAPRARRDLAIRAAEGLRATIQNATLAPGAAGEFALLAFGPGRVEVSGVTFALDAGGLEGSLAGIALRDAEATLRGCAFRRRGAAGGGARLVAVRAVHDPAAGALPEPLLLEGGHVDPLVQALWARGPFDGWLRDCTIGPSPSSFQFDNPAAAAASAPVPVRLGLDQCSILAGDGAVFRLDGARAAIRVDRSVIAPPPGSETTLVAIDDPARLAWVGRDNRYARVRAFLQPGDAAGAVVRGFDAWADGGSASRELDSRYGGPVWDQPDPLAALAADPGPAFRLDDPTPGAWPVGARRGAFGPIHDLAATPAADPAPGDLAAADSAAREPAEDDGEMDTMPEPMVVARPESDPPPPMTTGPEAVPAGAGPRREGGLAAAFAPLPAGEEPPPAYRPEPESRPAEPVAEAVEPVAAGADSGLATADALRRALAAPVADERRVDLLPGRTFELAAMRLPGPGRRLVQGPAGGPGPRPVLRFLPGDGMAPEDADPARRTWLTVEGGELELRHVDLVMDAGGATASLFQLRPGARLRLVDCSVTLEGPAAAGSALVCTPPEPVGADLEDEGEPPARRPAPVVVEVRDSLLRAGATLFLAEHAGASRVALADTVAAGSGALVQLGPAAAGDAPTDLTLDLDRSALRCAGGLLLVRPGPAPAPLPAVTVRANRSILSAPGGGEPLVRVEGQDRLDEAGAWLDWQGDGVVYDGIDVYRRDTSSTPGSVPQLFTRGDWELALAGRDRAPYHGRVSYAQGAGAGDADAPWRLRPGQLQPAADSPARDAGPDFARVPAPPPG
jgi:serine/threonine-protein kinase